MKKIVSKNFPSLEEFAGKDWKDIVGDGEKVASLAALRSVDMTMKKGLVPKYYTKNVECANCGIVKLWPECADKVLGCPWCHIKRKKTNE